MGKAKKKQPFDREAAKTKLRTLKQKASAARKEGKRDMAKAFRAGAQRLARKLKSIPEPPAPKEAPAEAAAPAQAAPAEAEAAPEEAASGEESAEGSEEKSE